MTAGERKSDQGGRVLETLHTYFGLHGKTAMITGAARGIGRSIAETLAGCGAAVVVSDLNEAGCQQVAKAINDAGGTAYALEMDIGDQLKIEEAFATAEQILSGRLDILVNNAGMMSVMPLFDDRIEIWDRTYAVNIRGTFLCSREAARIMKKVGQGGRIINISSSSAVRPVLDGIAPYSSSKGAVNTMTQGLAYDLAPDNITVNAVMPHSIMHPDVTKQYEENKLTVTGGAAMDEKRYRMPRQGEPQDIASLVAFLAGPGAGYITGQLIAADGGYLVT